MCKTPIIVGALLTAVLLAIEACTPLHVPEDETFIEPSSQDTSIIERLSPDVDFVVFTDTIGKFSVEYPYGWVIDEVSGEDAYNLSFWLLMELDQVWEDEISLGFVYNFHRSEHNAEWFSRQWASLADEDLISTSTNIVENLSYWETKEKLGEKVLIHISCDWEDGLLHMSYDFPRDSLTEMEIGTLHDYALHMLSTFRIYGLRLSEREINIHKLVNEYRQQNGLCALELNEFMSTLAREHSERQSMLNPISFSGEKGLGISHEGFNERAERILTTLGASIVGENVAMGYDNSASLVDAWLNSPEHRENIMNPTFRRTGIGLAGSIATQIFSD